MEIKRDLERKLKYFSMLLFVIPQPYIAYNIPALTLFFSLKRRDNVADTVPGLQKRELHACTSVIITGVLNCY